jgi:hypothetical protein
MKMVHTSVNKFVISSYENFYKCGKIVEYIHDDVFKV